VIITPVSLSNKVIAICICIFGLILVSGCTSSVAKESIAGKYFIINSTFGSYMELNHDGTCYLFDHETDTAIFGFNCTYAISGNTMNVCYPKFGSICDNWTFISNKEIVSPAGLHGKKVK
jgi:hypothetical protein